MPTWTPQNKSSTGNPDAAGEFDVGRMDEALFDVPLAESGDVWTPQSKNNPTFTGQTKN